jgi:hypothetical protein
MRSRFVDAVTSQGNIAVLSSVKYIFQDKILYTQNDLEFDL